MRIIPNKYDLPLFKLETDVRPDELVIGCWVYPRSRWHAPAKLVFKAPRPWGEVVSELRKRYGQKRPVLEPIVSWEEYYS